MKSLKKVLDVILSIYSVIVYVFFSFLVQCYTAYVVGENWNALMGFIAFCSPVISNIILIVLFSIAGGIFNPYNIVIFIYIFSYVPIIILALISAYLEKKIEETSIIKTETNNQDVIVGEAEDALMYCPDCGKKVDPEWKYCNYCGNKLD